MSRKGRRSSHELVPWLSANTDNKEGRFIQLGNSLLLSEPYQALSAGARWTYQCMAMESGGKREFTFSETEAKKYGINPRSLRNHIAQLLAAGFIETTANFKHAGRKNEYRFSLAWKLPRDTR